MFKYYQIFISSPTDGYETWRENLIKKLLKRNKYFPIGMEYMNANDETFSALYGHMEKADVCVLLLGEKLGTEIENSYDGMPENMKRILGAYVAEVGLDDARKATYTEFEYAVARHLGISVLMFCDFDEKSIKDENVKRLYNAARQIGTYSVCKDYNADDIALALDVHIENNDLPGWIREKDSRIYQSAESAGIVDISRKGSIPRDKLEEWLTDAKSLKLCFTTGNAFVSSNQTILSAFVANGGSIQLLCCKPHSKALNDVRNIEEPVWGDRAGLLNEFDSVHNNLKNVLCQSKCLNVEKNRATGTVQVGFLSTLFRSSFLIVEKEYETKGWFTVTLPPAKSNETVSFEISLDKRTGGEDTLLNRALKHFSAVWENAIRRNEVFEVESDQFLETDCWKRKEKTAIENMRKRKRCKRILIEVAAQHPLVDGETPNAEFAARLDRAIEVYNSIDKNKYDVEIYVPGSVHLDFDGVEDEHSLSNAGRVYLMKNNIAEECIHGDDLNSMYDEERFHKGVYNSADECFVASKYFLNNNEFCELYSICSPNQLMRKMLFYIEFGVYPKIITVPVQEMYHNFTNELFTCIPYILDEDQTYQGENSKEAKRTRNERMPGYKG